MFNQNPPYIPYHTRHVGEVREPSWAGKGTPSSGRACVQYQCFFLYVAFLGLMSVWPADKGYYSELLHQHLP